MPMNENLMDKVVSLCKRRGFIFHSSEIYGGLSNTWDYGPYGVELKNNLKRSWWKSVVYGRDDVFGMDAAILMHPKVWEASGHVQNFFDLKSDCKSCKKRFKAADLKEGKKCPECGGELTEARPFNLMFKTHQGAVEDAASSIYLRPETAQGMFVNFLNILDSKHPKLPFGLAQIGKAFRNEITPGNFTFRTREFEQMEIEYFVRPEEADEKLEEWIEARFNWYLNLGIRKDNLRQRPHGKDELAHYAKACTDIEYNFPFGWSELYGLAHRGDFDLSQHAKFSGQDLSYLDQISNHRYIPHVLEPTFGVDRSVLVSLVSAYTEEKVGDEERVVLKFPKNLAPIKVAIFPLLKNKEKLVEKAKGIFDSLKTEFMCEFDDNGNIGKRYRRQDEIGTPYCVTVDFDTLDNSTVTVRDRDSMEQERVEISQLKNYLTEKIC